ncbi:MAG: flagellar biosynthesis protein FlhF [Desulfovibrionales bacterium]|nr:MAG: flagellar biosynthesis protein FlhF [Desulfovibrionales bacterium]
MRVKTFRGPDTRTVLKQIRAELGPDAVILSTQTTKDGGKPCCEIMAALEPTAEASSDQASLRSEAARDTGGTYPGWRQMHQEWTCLKEHLFSVLKPQADYNLLSPRQRQALEYLEREEVLPEVAMHLWRSMKNTPEKSILEELRGIVAVKPWTGRYWPERLHAFAGPHGAGKTSSLLRLALNLRREYPNRRIALANADQHHGKGRLLLQHYAELGEFPFVDLRTPDDWRQLLHEPHDMVFIDLPGLPTGEYLDTWLIQKEIPLRSNCAVHLVLSPHYSTTSLQGFIKKFQVPALSSLIWTKLDEAETFGSLVNIGYFTRLPVSALSFGASLSSSLAVADHQNLWKLVFTHRMPSANGSSAERLLH